MSLSFSACEMAPKEIQSFIYSMGISWVPQREVYESWVINIRKATALSWVDNMCFKKMSNFSLLSGEEKTLDDWPRLSQGDPCVLICIYTMKNHLRLDNRPFQPEQQSAATFS